METTYQVDVSPDFGPELSPIYRASIYRMIPAGICGPFSEEAEFDSFDAMDVWLLAAGFVRSAPFGPLCQNGFASAPLRLAVQDEIVDSVEAGR